MKILLISANNVTEPYPVYPLSLDYVASAISKKHDVKIIDINEFKDENQISNFIKEFIPDVIGFSIRNIDNTSTIDTESYIKHYKKLIDIIRKNSNAKIVLGGSGFTIFPNEVISFLEADYGVIGEGERFNLLLNAIEDDEKSIKNIPGIISKDNFKEFPLPYRESIHREFNPNNTHIQFYIKNGGMLNLQSKRGCTLKCIYCTYPHIEGRELRLFDPKEVAATAKELEKAGAKYLFITDSAFNCNTQHSLEIAKAFIKEKISIPWGAFFIPSKPSIDYFNIMKDAGLSHVEFGTESMSNTVLQAYRKPFNADNVLQAHKLANNANLHVAHYMLMGGPGETENTVKETLVNLDKLDKTVIFFFNGIRIYPGTELHNIAVEEGQITKEQNLLEPLFYQSESITSEEITKIVKEKNKNNWIVGSGGEKTAKILAMMYRRGHTGPLWEYLIK